MKKQRLTQAERQVHDHPAKTRRSLHYVHSKKCLKRSFLGEAQSGVLKCGLPERQASKGPLLKREGGGGGRAGEGGGAEGVRGGGVGGGGGREL